MNKKTAEKILQKVQKDYENIAEQFHKTRKNGWEEFELFLEYIQNNNKIADLGCGNGRFFTFIKEKKKIDYVGVDISKNLIKKAKSAHPKAQFIVGDLLALPLKNANFDVVTAIASLHHIASNKLRKKALSEMHRILRKDGILILTNWNLFQPKYKKYIWKSRFKSLLSLGTYESKGTLIPWSNSGVERYYYAFSEKELQKILEENGFKIIESVKKNNFVHICQKV